MEIPGFDTIITSIHVFLQQRRENSRSGSLISYYVADGVGGVGL